MALNLLKYLDRRIPRYTSYPTAAQFGPGIDAGSYERWLAALPVTAPVSVYVHVPFCAELCLYCGCHTTVARRYAPVEAYVELLTREIALVGGIVGGRPAIHLHWGGGTPTILAPDDFRKVMTALRTCFVFDSTAELAIEIDPRTLTRDYVDVLAEAGITRASLGVQDFNARVQTAVNRVQSFEQTARVADWLRAAGIGSINLDLMYGLPYQSVATVEATVRRALALDADRIVLFGYAHVPWMKRHQRLIPEPALPDSSERFAQSRAAADVLIAAGYEPIGLDHFAKSGDLLAQRQREGRLRRNFQGYTSDEFFNPYRIWRFGNWQLAGRIRPERAKCGCLSRGRRRRAACHSARICVDAGGPASARHYRAFDVRSACGPGRAVCGARKRYGSLYGRTARARCACK